MDSPNAVVPDAAPEGIVTPEMQEQPQTTTAVSENADVIQTVSSDPKANVEDKVDDNANDNVEEKKEGVDANEWTNASTFKGASFNSSIINTINTVVGAAIISISYSIQISGVWGALILLSIIMVPSLLTTYYIACATLYTKEDIYGVIGTKLTNKTVGVLCNICVIVLHLGIDIAYMNIGFNQIEAMGRDIFNQGEFFSKHKVVGSVIFIISHSITFAILQYFDLTYSLSAWRFLSFCCSPCVASRH